MKKLKVFESQKYDIEAVLKDIVEFNRGNVNFESTVDSIIKNLGYNPTQDIIKQVGDHISASIDDNDKIPEDKDLIKELYYILENKSVNEGLFDDIKQNFKDAIDEIKQNFSDIGKDFLKDKQEILSDSVDVKQEVVLAVQNIIDQANTQLEEIKKQYQDKLVTG